jgi:DeoR/GlpR family transcriptional regulator of sugar metabolism
MNRGQGVVGGAKETRTRIIAYLQARPWRTTKQIAAWVHRSPSTVRRYLKDLDAEGVLQKRHRYVSQFGYTWDYALVGEGEDG